MGYDEQYSSTEAVFGTEAEPSLVAHADILATGGTVLDIGAGQGRNTLFLARRGLTVHALEPSAVAATALRKEASREDLPVTVSEQRFEDFAPQTAGYQGIVVCGLTPDLEWAAIHGLMERLARWGAPDSLLWITGFTIADPAHAEIRAKWTTIGPNSYRRADGRVRTYLERDQILKLLPTLTVVHHREALGPEHRHGDGPVERHGMFEAVFRRPT